MIPQMINVKTKRGFRSLEESVNVELKYMDTYTAAKAARVACWDGNDFLPLLMTVRSDPEQISSTM